jgi:hypothetical protein
MDPIRADRLADGVAPLLDPLALADADPAEPSAHRARGDPPRVLLLFDQDWDADGHARSAHRYRFVRDGFDLFRLPSALRLATFDLDRFVDALCRRHGDGLAAVVSNHEQFGALAAAMVARRLGLPGTAPEAIVACQHKLHCRQVLERVAPEANLPYFLLPWTLGEPPPEGLGYPLFVKPLKAAYSVLARRVDDRDTLAEHLRFGPLETALIRRLVRPFDRAARRLNGIEVDAHRMIAERPVSAPQYNLDGFVHRGDVRCIGVVDEVMYPGTQAFLRFQYPSTLDPDVQARAFDVARRFLNAVGFEHGFFNMEFFHEPADGSVRVIEFNPRLGSQLADLYRRVDGIDLHAMNLALACGRDPRDLPRAARRDGVAASFVFRSFDGATPPRQPDAAQRDALARTFPDALLLGMPRRGRALAREYKWLGSHRYGVLHLGAADSAALAERYTVACRVLGWPASA